MLWIKYILHDQTYLMMIICFKKQKWELLHDDIFLKLVVLSSVLFGNVLRKYFKSSLGQYHISAPETM